MSKLINYAGQPAVIPSKPRLKPTAATGAMLGFIHSIRSANLSIITITFQVYFHCRESHHTAVVIVLAMTGTFGIQVCGFIDFIPLNLAIAELVTAANSITLANSKSKASVRAIATVRGMAEG